jgi:hypothetical protein
MLTRLTAAVLVRFSTALLQGLVAPMLPAMVAAAAVGCWLGKRRHWVRVPTPSLLAPMLAVVALVGPPFVEPCPRLEGFLGRLVMVGLQEMVVLGVL